MPSRQQYRASDIVVSVDGFPFTGLSDADDAVTVSYTNPRYGDVQHDLYGRGGVQVKNEETELAIVLKFKIDATIDLDFLQVWHASGFPKRIMTGVNLGSNTSAFSAQDISMSEPGSWTAGKNPAELVFAFKAVRGAIVFGGQRILPV